MLIIAVLGSIIAGVATPTEAAALGALGASLLPLLERELDWRQFVEVLRETTRTTAMILFVRGNEPGTFEMRPVEAGLRLGDEIAVHAGVAEGEEVVVEGTVLLKGELMRAELGGED